MWQTFRWMGIVTGALSILMLIKSAFDETLAAPMRAMLDYYHAIQVAVLTPFRPVVSTIVDIVKASGIAADLSWFWQDIFAIMVVMFAAYSRGSVFTPTGYVLRAGWVVICAAYACIDGLGNPVNSITALIDDEGRSAGPLGTALWSGIVFSAGCLMISLIRANENRGRDLIVFVAVVASTCLLIALLMAGFLRGIPAFLMNNYQIAFPEALLDFVLYVSISGAVLLFLGAIQGTRQTLLTAARSFESWKTSTAVRIATDTFAIPAAVALFLAANAGLRFAGL